MAESRLQPFGISRRRFVAGATALVAASTFPGASRAQSYATRPIKLIVGNGAGGANDTVARLIAPVLAEKLGQPCVVDNRPGGAGTIGLDAVAKSPPDGHTLFISSAVMLASAHTHQPMAVNPVTDLEHISMICDGYFIFSVNPAVPAKNVTEFIALAKSSPGKLNYGTPGAGGHIHVLGELFKLRTGTDIVAIHYKTAGALTTDLLSNEIQMSIQAPVVIGPHIKAGKVRPLFIASKKRDADYPDIPTSIEMRVPDVDTITNWFGIHAPKGTPPSTVAAINAIVVEAVRSSSMREKFAAAGGFVPVGDSPAEFRARLISDFKLYGDVIRAAKVTSA